MCPFVILCTFCRASALSLTLSVRVGPIPLPFTLIGVVTLYSGGIVSPPMGDTCSLCIGEWGEETF